MSFTDAANELSVTPAALSFQIKGLESAVGTPLFIRRHRAIELTEAGKRLWPGIARGFTEIQSAWRLVKEQRREDRITITTGPAFTAKWLGPRLGKFVRANPDIEIRFCTTLALLDFVQDNGSRPLVSEASQKSVCRLIRLTMLLTPRCKVPELCWGAFRCCRLLCEMAL